MKPGQSQYSSKLTYLGLSAALTAVGTLGLRAAWHLLLKRSIPQQNGRLSINGLLRPVEVIRDRWGVPHIYAENESDLFFAQGYIHAQDRLFQMDIHRRVGAGRLSEISGPASLAMDRFARYFGWPRAARAQAENVCADVAGVMEAYCAGVNAFIDYGKLPVEFKLLAYRPEPWKFIDTASWGTVLAWGLSVNWESELVRSYLLKEIRLEKTADLTILSTSDYQTIIPDSAVESRLAETMLSEYKKALSGMLLGSVPTGHGIGSNNWVVSGEHTQSGRPMLANDPHLPPVFPAIWYENHLNGGNIHVAGFTMPGVPGVIIGHNENVAWGLTNAFPDVQDIFIERFHPGNPMLYEVNGRWAEVELVREEIKVRGKKPLIEQVRYTRHGPVFSDLLEEDYGALALKWASFAENDHLRAIVEMNRAANWSQFREALRHWGFPSQNVVYADSAGQIGYMMPGLVPRRQAGSGIVPVPGWQDTHEWQGWVPFEELPQCFNPPSGLIVTANNRVHGDSYPHFLTSEWLPDYRAKRIKSLLLDNRPLGLADHARIQTDTFSLQAREYLELALPIVEKTKAPDPKCGQFVRLLRSWDFNMDAQKIEPSIYFGWLTFFVFAAYAQALGQDAANKLLQKRTVEGFPLDPYLEVAPAVVMKWLAEGSPAWVGGIEGLLMPALQKTIARLEKRYGVNPQKWQWGNLHYIRLQHPVTRFPIMGRSWKQRQFAAGGDGYTVNQSDIKLKFPPDPVGVFASCRMIVDVGEWDNSLAVLPGGQSAHPASPHYLDGLEDWRNGRYHPMLFSRDKVTAAAESRIIFEPEPMVAFSIGFNRQGVR